MLDICLLGEPSFLFERRPHAFSAPPKTLPLLCLLLLRRGGPVSREQLAGLLWPEIDEEDARTNLRRHLHYLQNTLPPGQWMLADRKSVQWNPDAPYRLDVAEFERQSKYAQLRKDASELYRGDLAAGCDDEALFYDRDRLRTLQLNNLAALCADAERARDPASAEQFARALIALDPWREDAVRAIMRARMQAGDRAGALAEYERFRERLRAELDVEPDAQTSSLYESFAKQQPAAPAPAASDPGLIGRASETDALLLQWRRAESGQGAVVLVGGEAGAGKTRLLQSFAQHVRSQRGDAVFADAGSAAQTAFEPLARALGLAAGRTESHPLAAASERGTVFASFAAAMEARAAKRPLLLCVEDLHWAGADFIALLEFLARRLRGHRVLIAGTYRDDAIAPDHPLWAMRRSLSSRSGFAHITLAPLDKASAEELIRSRLGAAIDAATVDSLYRRSGGNAFFLTELIEYAASGSPENVPESVRALVRARAQTLSSSALELALLFAAAGISVPPGVASELLRADGKRAADELVRTRFLREEPTPAGITYAFVHDLVRQAFYALASEGAVASAHARLAQTFENAGSEFAAARAYHYERAGAPGDASREYAAAARRAVASYANEEAERFARAALSLGDDAAVHAEAYEVLINLFHRRADRREDQLAAIDGMETAALRTGDPMLRVRAAYNRLALAFVENDEPALTAGLQSFAEIVPDSEIWRARVRLFDAASLLLRGDPQRAWEAGLEAMERCAAANYTYGQLFCCVWLLQFCDGFTRPYADLLETGRALERDVNDPDAASLVAAAEARIFLHVDRSVCVHAATRLLEAGERAGDRGSIGVAQSYLGAVAMYRFEPDDAFEHLNAARALLSESPRRMEYAQLVRFLGLYWYSAGEVERGLDASLQALDLARQSRSHELIAIGAANAVFGLRLLDRLDEASALAESVLQELHAVREEYFVIHHLMTTYGHVRCEMGDFERGIPALERAYEVHRERRYHLQTLLIGATLAFELVKAGRGAEAASYLDEVERSLDELADEGFMPQEPLWYAAQASRAIGERDRSALLLNAAASIVVSSSERFSGSNAREVFLQMPLNRAILRAHGDRLWPTL